MAHCTDAELEAWAQFTGSSPEETEAEFTESDSDTDHPSPPSKKRKTINTNLVLATLLWPAKRLQAKGLPVFGGETPEALIPSDPDDDDYNPDDNDASPDQRVYQRVIRRRRGLRERFRDKEVEEVQQVYLTGDGGDGSGDSPGGGSGGSPGNGASGSPGDGSGEGE